MRKQIFALTIVLSIATWLTGCGQQSIQGTEKKTAASGTTVQKSVMPAQKEPTVAKTPQVTTTVAGSGEELLVADFNTGETPNNIGGGFGAWDKDPADFSQSCTESFDSVNRRGVKGFAMKIDYDVDSKNPAYNGFWMFLQNVDASKYNSLSFWVKGDAKDGYTTVFKVELKNDKRQVGRYYVTNVTDQWQKIVIPLKEFKGITDFSSLTEFVIVFEDRIVSNKDGVIYIDDIAFTKGS